MTKISKCDVNGCANENATCHIVIWRKGFSSKKGHKAEIKGRDICEDCFQKLFQK